MKDVKSTLLDRRSIRRYEREQITAEQIEFIREAIRNTPTSYNGQQYSVIDITDTETKLALEAMTGQKQIKTCSHFMLFCADYHKINLMAEAKKVEMPAFAQTMDGIVVGVVDASLAMMSAIVASDAVGLGCCPIGFIRTKDPEGVCSMLGLPEGVFPVCGLAIGVPREMPDMHPKQPEDALIHTDRYAPDSTLLPLLKEYDAKVTEYNATRSGTTSTNDWAEHIIGYYREGMGYHTLAAMAAQGLAAKK
ncbi:MAG: nitroreductase family protein [Muribaculaceae bacterium]|nr:nitroreductase family protein [Muribaculaceae bacterium]